MNKELREKAIEILKQGKIPTEDFSKQDLDEIVQELNIYHIELEMQHEELKKTQEKLKESHDLFQDLFENAPSGYLLIETTGKIRDINNYGVELFGIKKDIILTFHLQNFVATKDKVKFFKHISDVLKDGKTRQIEVLLSDNKALRKHVLFTSSRVSHEKSNVIRMFCIDITEKIHLEQRLKQLKVAMDNAADMMILYNPEKAEIVDVNNTFFEMTGYYEAELSTLKLTDFFEQERKSTIFEFLSAIARREVNYHEMDVGIVRKDGTTFPANMSLRPFSSSGKRMYVIILRNSEQQIAYEQELITAREAAESGNRAKSEFLSNMSHELRTPMNAIMGMAQLLEKSGLNEKQQKQVQILTKASENMLKIVTDLLEFSRLEAGKIRLFEENVSIHEIIENVYNYCIQKAVDKNLLLFWDITDNTPELIVIDRIRLEEVLINLVDNAIKYTEEGRIDIVVSKKVSGLSGHEQLEFMIKDTGIGIDEAIKASIFNRFQQGDMSETKMYNGMGIGLALVREIVELMNGNLTFESDSNGTMFFFTIPLREGLLQEKEKQDVFKQEEKQTLEKDYSVLIAEDNEGNMFLMKASLEEILPNAVVYEAVNGEEAVKIFCEHKPDISLIDIMMPIMNGNDAAKKIRSEFGDAPILIAVTALANEIERDICMKAGFTDYLQKPFAIELLRDLILKYIS